MDAMTLHGAASTKAMTYKGYLLTQEDYKKLMKAQSLDDFIQYLKKETYYKELLSHHTPTTYEALEALLKLDLFKRIEGLIHFYHHEYKRLFKVIFMRYEVENIKLYLRAIARDEDLSHLQEHVITSDIFTNLDYGQFAKVSSISAFITLLADTPYEKILRPYIGEEAGKMIFYMEMTLDRFYFNQLKKVTDKLKGQDHEVMKELLGVNSDLLNLQWIYRAKKYYKIAPEEIVNYTLESGKRLLYPDLKKLSYSNLEQVKEAIKESRYKSLLAAGPLLVELAMERYLYSFLKKLQQAGKNTLATPLVVMHLMEYEMRDLFTMMECIRYQQEDIRQYLVNTG